MSALHDLQSAFMAALRGADAEALAGSVRPAGLTVTRRLGVYRNNLRTSLTESLKATYPAILALVGDQFFDMLARHHIDRHPSRSGDLHRFGAEFPDTLPDIEAARPLPYLADVARLEWAYHTVFHAADRDPIAVTALSDIEPDSYHRLVLDYHPASSLVASRWPVLDIWRLAVHDSDPEQRLDIDRGGQNLLVARRGLEMEFQQLSAAEYRFIEGLIAARPLTDCLDDVDATDAGFDLSTVLARQFDLGNIVGYSLPAVDGGTGRPGRRSHARETCTDTGEPLQTCQQEEDTA